MYPRLLMSPREVRGWLRSSQNRTSLESAQAGETRNAWGQPPTHRTSPCISRGLLTRVFHGAHPMYRDRFKGLLNTDAPCESNLPDKGTDFGSFQPGIRNPGDPEIVKLPIHFPEKRSTGQQWTTKGDQEGQFASVAHLRMI